MSWANHGRQHTCVRYRSLVQISQAGDEARDPMCAVGKSWEFFLYNAQSIIANVCGGAGLVELHAGFVASHGEKPPLRLRGREGQAYPPFAPLPPQLMSSPSPCTPFFRSRISHGATCWQVGGCLAGVFRLTSWVARLTCWGAGMTCWADISGCVPPGMIILMPSLQL